MRPRLVGVFALIALPLFPPAMASAQQRPLSQQRSVQQRPLAPRALPDRASPVAAARRDSLEARVIRRFVERAGGEMALDATQRRRLDEVLQATADRRRLVNQRSADLQRRMNQAVRRPATPAAVFDRLLQEQRTLRVEHQRILDQEQDALGEFLTPRQRAHFQTLWVRLQQDARQIQAQQPDGGLPQ